MEPILDQVSILYENRHLVFTDERFGRVVRFYFGMGGILSESSKKVNSVKPEVVWTHEPLLETILANELCLCEEYNKKHETEENTKALMFIFSLLQECAGKVLVQN